MPVLPEIKTIYDSLTNAEKRVADVVLHNARQVIFLSISELGDLARAGDATVLRFCRKIGFQSYQALKLALSMEVGAEEETGSPDRMVRDGDTVETILDKTFRNIADNLQETRMLANPAALEGAAERILRADRIAMFGVGGSGIIAQDTASKFMRIGVHIEYCLDVHAQLMLASILSPSDLAIGISFSGSTRDTLAILHTAKQNGVPVICITHHARSPLAELSDLILLHGSNESPLQGGDSSTKISQLSIVEALYHVVYMKLGESARRCKWKTSNAVLGELT